MLARPASLRCDQLDTKGARELARDLVLQSEQIADVAVEPLGPKMRVGLSVDQLGVDADLVGRPPDASSST